MTKRVLLRTLERERIAFAQERAHMIDVICHLAGSDWTPPPQREPLLELEPGEETFPDPQQLP